MSISSAVKPYTFSNGTKANATQVNSNFDTVYTGANAAIAALNNAAGSKSSLDGRLDVSMNADGTMKDAITSGGEWINPDLSPTYASALTFTVAGDQRDIYLADRMLRIVLAGGTIYRMVSTSVYSSGSDTTTVTIASGGASDLTNPITSIEHGIISPAGSSVSSVNCKIVTGYLPFHLNIPSSIVIRDASGNFSAGTVTANLTGNVTGTASSATNADTVDSQHAAMLAPPGAVMAFAMSTVPTGWLECNGAAVSRSTYAPLFGAIGTTWGSGNGSTTFNVPDLRGEFIRGWDHSKGTDSGRTLGSYQEGQNAAHTHTVAHSKLSGVSAGVNICGGSSPTTDTTTTSSSGGTEARPRNWSLMYCIKT
jgi:microcystin-dependent protein